VALIAVSAPVVALTLKAVRVFAPLLAT